MPHHHKVVIVVDINGVLGEVSKKCIPNNGKGILLPSGQRFYLNSAAQYFLETLSNSGYPLVLWTSRLYKNARPIEDTPSISNTPFIMMLHGENCIQTKYGGFHPIKRVSTLRERLSKDLKDAEIIFVDDSPRYVETDGMSEVIMCETYKAEEDNYWNLQEVLSKITARTRT